MSFLSNLAAHLASHGIGTVGTDIFMGEAPPEQLNAVLLVSTGGPPSDRARGILSPTVQVTARNLSYAAAEAKIDQVFVLLNELPEQVNMGSSHVVYCKAMQLPFCLGKDEREAWRHVCNFRFSVSRT